MAPYRHIVVPVDGSRTATRGLREAIRLAKALGSRLTILHIVVDYMNDDVLERAAVYSPGLLEVLRQSGRRTLEAARRLAAREGIEAKAVLVERPGWITADIILEQARKLRASLVVMGTHGRRGMHRLVLGSDAEQVVRLTPVPVLLVRGRPARRARGRR